MAMVQLNIAGFGASGDGYSYWRDTYNIYLNSEHIVSVQPNFVLRKHDNGKANGYDIVGSMIEMSVRGEEDVVTYHVVEDVQTVMTAIHYSTT